MRASLTSLALSALSGLLLFVSDFPPHAWPLQTVALLPFLFALERRCSSRREALLSGLTLGLTNTLPLLRVLEFPLTMGLPLAIYLSLLWTLIGLFVYLVRGWPTPLGPLAAGAIVAVVEWVDFTLVPVWGTAQCFARVWTAAPFVAQIVSAAGVTGLVFLLVSVQALLGRLIWGGAGRRTVGLLTLVILASATAGWCAWAWTRPARGELTVAAVGWTSDDLVARELAPPPRRRIAVARPEVLFDQLYQPLVEQAVRQGAELVVSPEVGFQLEPTEEDQIVSRATELARRTRAALVIGYFSWRRHSNHALIVDGRGTCRSEYTKSHLIPLLERYRKGSGALVTCQLERPGSLRPRVGMMICQDDNFTDLARGYGRAGAAVVAVPTNDWRQVKEFHLENSILRAIENDYAVVRASSNGVSVIVSPRGEVLARRDHFRDGPGLAIARVSLRGGPTFYSSVGDWPPLAGALLLVAVGLSRWRARRRRL
jgi:apolipoprotein N-acyltransferase